MSLDLLKATREAAVAGVHAAEALFSKHQAAAAAAPQPNELAALADSFKALVAQVEQAIASVEAEAAKTPTLADLKALVAKL